jgi:hypothetical protein
MLRSSNASRTDRKYVEREVLSIEVGIRFRLIFSRDLKLASSDHSGNQFVSRKSLGHRRASQFGV